jgi:hypothetical protein
MSPEEYDARLAQRVAQWEAKNPTEAAELRLSVRRAAGLVAAPPEGSFRAQVLERYFWERVRELKGWPTEREWMRSA